MIVLFYDEVDWNDEDIILDMLGRGEKSKNPLYKIRLSTYIVYICTTN